MYLSAADALQVLATKFAHDMLRHIVRCRDDSTLDIWSHHCDFVLSQALPVFAVHVTFVTIEVLGVAVADSSAVVMSGMTLQALTIFCASASVYQLRTASGSPAWCI